MKYFLRNRKLIIYQDASGNKIPAAPVNIIQPTLVGTGEVGVAVTCNKGTWSGVPTPTYTYDFKINGVSVQNSPINSYTPTPSDEGGTLTCEVTATNASGTASATTSNSLVIGTRPANTVAPTLSPSGTRVTGTVITASVGTWTGTPTITYEYRWTRNGTPISGATNSTYTIQAADDGTTIRVEVRGTNGYGTSAYVVSSNSVSAVNAVAPVNTGAPVISGNQWTGQTLSATTGTWTGIPTPTYSYQWKRGVTNIGTNSPNYTLVNADMGQNITCVVTASNAGGSANATSNSLTILETPLDLQNAALGYSAAYLLRGAHGSNGILRLRRTSDNAEVNVFADSTGMVSLASTVTGGSTLATWIGSNSATVARIYDQTGNNRDFIISTPSQQPSFIVGGVINTRNSRPTMRFNGTSTYLQQSISAFLSAAQFNVFTVYSTVGAAAADTARGTFWHLGNATVSTMVLAKGSSTGILTGEFMFYDVRRTVNGSERLASSTYRRGANTLVQETDQFLTTGTTSRQNSTAQTLDLSGGGATTTANYTPANSAITGDYSVMAAIIGSSPVNYVDGDLSEQIVYIASVTASTIETNQRTRFGL